jgi:hypothetical protein
MAVRSPDNDFCRTFVACIAVLHQLVLAVIPDTTSTTLVRLLVSVSALMVVAIADGGEALNAVLTFVRLLSSVSAHMNKQIATLIKGLKTVGIVASEVIVTKTAHVEP